MLVGFVILDIPGILNYYYVYYGIPSDADCTCYTQHHLKKN